MEYLPMHKAIHICNSLQPPQAKNCKRVCLFQRYQQSGKKYENTTLYKNNSGLIAKTKVSKFKKGLCLSEKLVRENPVLFLY
jgi:hypothetical protein